MTTQQDQQHKQYEEMQKMYSDWRFEHFRAHRRHQESQADINNRQRQQYAAIVAVDLRGAFSKDGQIPWHYPDDFKWFQSTTKGHVCVMGRATYDDINARMGEKGEQSVLPGRMCFVVTSSPLPRDNAIAVTCIGDVDKYLTPDDAVKGLKVFFIGGEGIYREGIAKANTLYITVVNKEVEGDKFFPTNYALKHFGVHKVLKHENAPDLRFTIWTRKNG